MNKVVVNKCYGGFSLSPLAIKRYYELTQPELELFFYKRDWISDIYNKVSVEEATDIFSKDFGEILVDDNDDIDDYYIYPSFVRHDPVLVQVVEELGEKANGRCADLKVIEVLSDRYYIDEYDGMEWVETPESIRWTFFSDDK